jgi:hypothetical protein
MYTVSEIVEMGEAHELVLSQIKQVLQLDDSAVQSMPAEDHFDN